MDRTQTRLVTEALIAHHKPAIPKILAVRREWLLYYISNNSDDFLGTFGIKTEI